MWLSVGCDRPFEHAGNAPAGEAGSNLQCQALTGETVDHAQDAETLSGGRDIAFNGTRFVVDDVQQNQLVLRDLSNQKKTTLNFTP